VKALPPLDPETFQAFGFFVRRGFLSSAECARLRRAMSSGRAQAGEIRAGGRGVRARMKRRVDVVSVSAAVRARVDRAIQSVLPAVERHFGRRLRGHETVQYLRYRPGGRYALHTDRTPGTKDPDVRRRKVSVIVFLGRPGHGGELVFPATRAGERVPRVLLAIRPEPGLLIAFRPEIEHEVRPVRRGTRFTLATWCV